MKENLDSKKTEIWWQDESQIDQQRTDLSRKNGYQHNVLFF